MRIILIFLVSQLLTIRGTTQQNCENCGVAYQGVRLFKPERNAYILPAYERDIKYLFFDSMVIAERHGLFTETDSKNRETWRREVIGYTFIDFRTKTFYDYSHFSDTARVIKTMRQPAKGRVEGGWNFFDPPQQPPNSVALSDTVLDGVKCSRLKVFFTKDSDTTIIKTMYYVSEAECPLAYYGKTTVQGKRFSYIRTDDFDVASGLKTYHSMDITSNTLSKKELRIFAAWKRNAKKHPVKK
ncbi:MAG: hypothetical protein JWR72_1753 [Flavisolibacter sp.]|jgi:hypothetical protein|nr:hypothetical protein [Flavisolibacter sp.]